MLRALLILLAGILLAVLLAAVIAGDRDVLAALGPVLVTAAVGMAVLAVVAWRARIRERAQQLEDQDRDETRAASRGASTSRPAERVTDERIEDTDRG